MGHDKLTAKQEGYAQDRASGLDMTSAYRNNYATINMSEKTVWQESCRLDKNPKVSARIAELQQVTEAEFQQQRIWDKNRLLAEAETNLLGSRAKEQWASANGSLELIGRVTGLLNPDTNRDPPMRITRIEVIVPSPGAVDVVLESREIRQLGPGDEMDPEADDAS